MDVFLHFYTGKLTENKMKKIKMGGVLIRFRP